MDGFDNPAMALLLLVGVVVVAVIVIPLLLFGIELILLGLLIASGILGRALLGRPWVVCAVPASGHDTDLRWKVAGWRRSGRLIDEVSASLTSGIPPAPSEPCEGVASSGSPLEQGS
jgi:hypothetical protein